VSRGKSNSLDFVISILKVVLSYQIGHAYINNEVGNIFYLRNLQTTNQVSIELSNLTIMG
jgi:hypothetical protein